jgi:hypothetical protein
LRHAINVCYSTINIDRNEHHAFPHRAQRRAEQLLLGEAPTKRPALVFWRREAIVRVIGRSWF